MRGFLTPAGAISGERLAQLHAVVRDLADADLLGEVREGALHQMPVLDDVGHARRRARVVLEHLEAAVGVAHEVDAGDCHIGAERQVDAVHLAPVVRIARDELGRDEAVLEDLLLVVDVLDEPVDRGDALDAARLDDLPVGGRDDARDDVEGQDAVDRVLVGVNGEGDAEIEELAVGGARAALQRRGLEAAEALPDFLGVRRRPSRRRPEHFAVVAA